MAMGSTGATSMYFSMSADANYIYVAEYGDPTGGPTLYRSGDGTTWTSIYTEVGQSPAQRHIHAVAADPFNTGHVWMTLGDANAQREILRSVDNGNTWTVVTGASAWQGVQISFAERWVYIAGDSSRGHLIVVDRETNTPYFASCGLVSNISVPAPSALGDSFYVQAWIGAVDPLTGAYYFSANDPSGGGNTPGVFMVPSVGKQPVLIGKVSSAMSPVEIYGGYLWVGKYKFLLPQFVVK
jgi:hypothetical protein